MTIKGGDDDAAPSAPPLSERDEEVPVVQATAVPSGMPMPTASAASASVSVPPGMVAKTVTTNYPDGRSVSLKIQTTRFLHSTFSSVSS